jgi:hypothetical protein
VADREIYISRRLAARQAEVMARFEHPVTGAPMVTWHQTSTLAHEDEEFYSAAEREFHTWFERKHLA